MILSRMVRYELFSMLLKVCLQGKLAVTVVFLDVTIACDDRVVVLIHKMPELF